MWIKFDAALKASPWNQGELEIALKLPEGRISKWRSKTKNLSVLDALRLARTLGVSLDYLADDSQAEPPAPALSPDEQRLIAFVRREQVDLVEAVKRISAATPPGSHSPPNYASPATLTAPDPSKLPAAGLPSATEPERKSGGRSRNG